MPVAMPPYLQFLDSNGLPRNGGLVYTYAAGTLTEKATFTAADGLAQAQNPVLLNSSGLPDHGSGNVGLIWIQGSYDFLITNSDGSDPIWMRGVTSFNTVAPAGASYFQSFTGDGTQTVFALSQALGTDENAVLFFIDNGLVEFFKNGNFATDTDWTKGAGWTIASGVATATGAISTSINQTAADTINAGQTYSLQYTITQTAGSITPNIGGTLGTVRSAAGTYTETIVAGATQIVGFDATGFTGTLDNVSLKLIESQGREVVLPTEFTLNNTTITFSKAPKNGALIAGFAFSTLVAAASASAAAAEAFAQAANISAIDAASSATSLKGTSVTSNTIGVGSKSFTTQTGKNFYVGGFILISSNATPANYFYGQVTSYNTLTGALVVNVTETGGAGTATDWNIGISGVKGIPGTVTPSNNSIIYSMFTAAVFASSADILAGTASKILNAATFKAYADAYLETFADNSTAVGSGVDIILTPYAGVREIEIILNRVSNTNNANTNAGDFIIQLSDAGGYETAGYESSSAVVGSSATNRTDGFAFFAATGTGGIAALNSSHRIKLTRVDNATNSWMMTSSGNISTGNTGVIGCGTKSLSQALTALRIRCADGVSTWDAGTYNVAYR
jgi:hypothetical protein